MPDVLVLGLDIGGTSTRAVLATSAGARLAEGRAGGGNPVAHDAVAAATELGRALRAALSGADPGEVRAAVIGLAGAGTVAGNARAREAFERAWREAGLACGYRLVPDPVVAFAAGTPERDGTVLIAGTGAVAADVRGRSLQRIADGHGWLLGDAGSGFWLGREAVRLTLHALDSGRPVTELSRLVMLELLGTDEVAARPRETVSAIIGAVHARPPIALARLAPVVTSSYALGDPEAERLVQDAADRLMETVGVVRPFGEQSPVVLAGSLLSEGTPVAAAVRVRLSATWPESVLAVATEPAAAAAWLAGLDADPVEPDEARARHHRFVGG
jgi:N-acetylglucosamine kinase-like BadF-type ATPase